MLYKFLMFLRDEPHSLVFIIGFGVLPFMLMWYIFSNVLSAFGLEKVVDFLAKLFSFSIAITWGLGFIISITFILSGVNVFKVLLIVIGIFCISLTYSILNFNRMGNVFKKAETEK